jgi:uncharacterized protein (TIGR02757 family)
MKRKLTKAELKDFLDAKSEQYNRPAFIETDPIVIPHRYLRKQDIEIAGLFAAVLAWGQRATIISKCRTLLHLMDDAPFEFIQHHSPRDLMRLESFKHRTFNGTDTLYFVAFLRWYYQRFDSLEEAFKSADASRPVEGGLANFHRLFFSLPDFPHRTRKHIATPERKSTCKRLNMFLRWMVRKDERGVDFGIWHQINAADLICPCDVHVVRVARHLGLIKRKQTDWEAAMELTGNLRNLDPADPVKYDYALFGLGIEEGWSKARNT